MSLSASSEPIPGATEDRRRGRRIALAILAFCAAPPEAALLRDHAGLRGLREPARAFLAEFPAARGPSDHIYLLDPLGNLMLRFPGDPDAQGMVKDLTRLLRASRVG